MKKVFIFLTTILLVTTSTAEEKKEVQDSHTSIYTTKLKRIVNAMNIGDYSTEDEYYKMLEVACKRNQCNKLESQTILTVGQQVVLCQINHLKTHGIENPDATYICESKQDILGCDSIGSSLLRKMCYSGNKYSLRIWQEKEIKFSKRNSRMPASKSK